MFSSTNIRTILQRWGNRSLWEHLEIDGDGSWLIQGLLQGTIQCSSDGSYMLELCPDACSAAFMLICTTSKQKLVGMWAEKSPFASNYRGEIFGGMAIALILKAAYTLLPPNRTVSPVKLWFDNSGVILQVTILTPTWQKSNNRQMFSSFSSDIYAVCQSQFRLRKLQHM